MTRPPSPTSRKPTTPTQRVRLARHQFAFLRGWCQGLDERDLWERYFDSPYDRRRCRSHLRDLVNELAAIARRAERPDAVGLLRRRALEMTGANRSDGGPPLESLEEFGARFDDGMYSEAELIELWQEAQGNRTPSRGRSAAQRRTRLIERQLEVLDWLERHAAEVPRPADPISAWLDPTVCSRLQLAGVLSLGDLSLLIKAHGYRWFDRVPRIGEKGAGQLVRWIELHADSLGALPSSAKYPRRMLTPAIREALTPKATQGIVPFERLAVPSSLATDIPGRPGGNRVASASCKIEAVDDYQAIQAWLSMRPAGSHTWRAYRREAERFLLWSIFARHKPMSALTATDCAAYRDFLAKPGPEWEAPRNTERWSPNWRPFEGPLSRSSIDTAVTVVRAMCNWLVGRRYLDSNPWGGVPAADVAPRMPSTRSLSRRHWGLLEAWLSELPDTPANCRLRFLVGFGYRTGMRLAELAAARLSWLRTEGDDGEPTWSIMVLGKRKQWREVALPSSAVEILRAYLVERGLDPDPRANNQELPLVAGVEPGSQAPLTQGRIYEVLKTAFERCANDLPSSEAKAAERIRAASPHWLRHTYGTHAAESMSIDVLQVLMGHASPATTSIYSRAESSRRAREVEKAFG